MSKFFFLITIIIIPETWRYDYYILDFMLLIYSLLKMKAFNFFFFFVLFENRHSITLFKIIYIYLVY